MRCSAKSTIEYRLITYIYTKVNISFNVEVCSSHTYPYKPWLKWCKCKSDTWCVWLDLKLILQYQYFMLLIFKYKYNAFKRLSLHSQKFVSLFKQRANSCITLYHKPFSLLNNIHTFLNVILSDGAGSPADVCLNIMNQTCSLWTRNSVRGKNRLHPIIWNTCRT